MSIYKGQLKVKTSKYDSEILHPVTSVDQVEGLEELIESHYENFAVDADVLPIGSEPTANYDPLTDILTLGLPASGTKVIANPTITGNAVSLNGIEISGVKYTLLPITTSSDSGSVLMVDEHGKWVLSPAARFAYGSHIHDALFLNSVYEPPVACQAIAGAPIGVVPIISNANKVVVDVIDPVFESELLLNQEAFLNVCTVLTPTTLYGVDINHATPASLVDAIPLFLTTGVPFFHKARSETSFALVTNLGGSGKIALKHSVLLAVAQEVVCKVTSCVLPAHNANAEVFTTLRGHTDNYGAVRIGQRAYVETIESIMQTAVDGLGFGSDVFINLVDGLLRYVETGIALRHRIRHDKVFVSLLSSETRLTMKHWSSLFWYNVLPLQADEGACIKHIAPATTSLPINISAITGTRVSQDATLRRHYIVTPYVDDAISFHHSAIASPIESLYRHILSGASIRSHTIANALYPMFIGARTISCIGNITSHTFPELVGLLVVSGQSIRTTNTATFPTPALPEATTSLAFGSYAMPGARNDVRTSAQSYIDLMSSVLGSISNDEAAHVAMPYIIIDNIALFTPAGAVLSDVSGEDMLLNHETTTLIGNVIEPKATRGISTLSDALFTTVSAQPAEANAGISLGSVAGGGVFCVASTASGLATKHEIDTFVIQYEVVLAGTYKLHDIIQSVQPFSVSLPMSYVFGGVATTASTLEAEVTVLPGSETANIYAWRDKSIEDGDLVGLVGVLAPHESYMATGDGLLTVTQDTLLEISDYNKFVNSFYQCCRCSLYDGATLLGSEDIEYGELPAMVPTKEGFLFYHWEDSQGNVVTEVTSSMSLYAAWLSLNGSEFVFNITSDLTQNLYLTQSEPGVVAVSWGDNSPIEYPQDESAELSHTYASSGTYTVTIDCQVGKEWSPGGRFWREDDDYEEGGFYSDNFGFCGYTSLGGKDGTFPALQSISFGYGMTLGHSYSFGCCTGIQSIVIPSHITSIPNYAFLYCTALTSATIPGSIGSSFGSNIFFECSALSNVTLGSGITTIGQGLFYGCSSLTTLDIPSTVTTIAGNAFYSSGIIYVSGSSGANTVCLPNSITSIGSAAFENCHSLIQAYIPTNVTQLGDYLFYGCDALASIPTFPSGVTAIPSYCFQRCTSLGAVVITSGITEIGASAFKESGITGISFPNTLTTVRSTAFESCTSLTSVTFPTSVTHIEGYYLFNGCTSLTSVIFPEGLTGFDDNGNGSNGLSFNKCPSLQEVWFPSTFAKFSTSATSSTATSSYTAMWYGHSTGDTGTASNLKLYFKRSSPPLDSGYGGAICGTSDMPSTAKIYVPSNYTSYYTRSYRPTFYYFRSKVYGYNFSS